jgi:type II secretory pathway component PulF
MHSVAAHILVWLLTALLPVSALAAAVYYIASRPLRLEERARVLLDLIDTAAAQGQPVEQCLVSLARTRDLSLGTRLPLLAAQLERGLSLGAALEKVPGLAPAQMVAMLKVGESLGDYRRVLPACRETLHDGVSQTRALINYQAAFAFIVNPAIALAIPCLFVTVGPALRGIWANLKMNPPPAAVSIGHLLPVLFVLQLLAVLALYLFAALFLGGPRFVSWIERSLLPAADWLWLRAPWRRKRLQRDFSAMLALLLDANLPEERAVTLAAGCAANGAFARMGRQAVERLRAGAALPEALEAIDPTGEFRWRMENAARGGGFFSALKGWHEWLRARAYQQEQAAAQTVSTALVLLNAATVALVAAMLIGSIAQLSVSQFQ